MYLIHSASNTFWQVNTAREITEVCFGPIGHKGRVMVKQHATPRDASVYASENIERKKLIGYVEAKPKRRSERASSKKKTAPVEKAVKRLSVRQLANKKIALKIESASRKRMKTLGKKRKSLKPLKNHPHTKSSTSKRILTREKPSGKKSDVDKKPKMVSPRRKSGGTKRKRSVPRRSVKPKKPSTKRRKKTSTTGKSKKKASVKKTVRRKRSKKVAVRKSSTKKREKEDKKKSLNLTDESKYQQLTIGKPLVDESFVVKNTANVWIDKNTVYDAMLNLRNPEKNMDKFYILQVVGTSEGFSFHTRWGRTGTSGQLKTIGPFQDHKLAVKQFEKKFRAKTGVAWGVRDSLLGKANPNGKKYSILRINYTTSSDSVIWQYFVDDAIDGKSEGWYDYSKSGSAEVEKVWQQHLANIDANLGIRHIQSGYFLYEVDFRKMQQTNVAHPARKCRRIRRFAK